MIGQDKDKIGWIKTHIPAYFAQWYFHMQSNTKIFNVVSVFPGVEGKLW